MRLTPALALLCALAALPALAEEQPARQLLRGADCLDPQSTRSWQYLQDDSLLVDAGRRKYRITLDGACPELALAVDLHFKGDPVSRRLCGHVGETVRARGMSCRVDRIELIDKATYDEAMKQNRGNARVGTGKQGD